MKNNYENEIKDQELEKLLTSKIEDLKKHQPPDYIWARIEDELKNVTYKNTAKNKNFITNLISLVSVRKRIIYSFSSAVCLCILILFFIVGKSNYEFYPGIKNYSAGFYGFMKVPDKKVLSGKNTVILQQKKIIPKEALEDPALYEKRIVSLEYKIKDKKDSKDQYLKSIHNEKLSYLDESINECKTNLEDNRLNSVIKRSLISAYGEKIKVLLDILKN